MERNLGMIKKEADIFGLLFLGDGDTMTRCQLLNSLSYGENIPVDVSNFLIFKVI